MRSLSFQVNRLANLRAARSYEDSTTAAAISPRRRLDDQVEEVFIRACASRDVDAARDLLNLLEKWHTRRLSRYGRERRINGASLERLRKEFDRFFNLKNANGAET
jgi:hypothetical protein